MFSKEEIDKAIEVVKEDIDYIKTTDPSATSELDMLEFAIVSLEGYRDRESMMAMVREQELLTSMC